MRYDVEQLAQGFVEGSTRYDWADLPDALKAQLLEAAEAFARWADPTVIPIKPAGFSDAVLERFLAER